MFIRLKQEWHGYWKGSVLNLPDDEALTLLSTGKAVRAKPTDDMERYLKGPRLNIILQIPKKDK